MKRYFLQIKKGSKLWILLCVHLILFFILSGNCRYYKLERQLNDVNKQWLDEVSYIITSEERRMFLDLPDSEKAAFKEEFWQRRDPDPGTEENEFKMEYYDRIEQANELFFNEHREGYKTDRGRIYVLFGAPFDRITRPNSLDQRCQEVWYYGNFPVVFLDEFCTGIYKLVTYDLSALRTQNLAYMHELNQAQARAMRTIVGDAKLFNFEWDLQVDLLAANKVEGQIDIEFPLADLWFQDESGDLVTVLDLHLELMDAEEELIWSFDESYKIQIKETEIELYQKEKYHIQVPFVIDISVDRLKMGDNKMFVELINRTGEARISKVRAFRIK